MTLECDDESQHTASQQPSDTEGDAGDGEGDAESSAAQRKHSETLKRHGPRDPAYISGDEGEDGDEGARRRKKNSDEGEEDTTGDKATRAQQRNSTDEEAAVGDTPRRRRGQLFAPRRRMRYRRIPFMLFPIADDDGTWHKPEGAVTHWLSLFYNLLTGSSLSAFYSSHGLQRPAQIPSYFGYYTVVMSLWTSQLHYDLRFECNDVLHRMFKGFQILLFVYIASGSGGWDLTALDPPYAGVPDSPTPDEVQSSVDHEVAKQSFLTVSVVTAAHCGLLGVQYLIVFFLGPKVHRRTTAPRWSMVSLSIAVVFYIVSAALPANSELHARAKIALLYTGIFVQLAGIGVQAMFGVLVPAREGHLSSQYGSLSITILGFGFNNFVLSFQAALTGIGSASVGYAQVFLCIGVLYLIWVFLFANFQSDIDVDAGRTWLWEWIHFPLHLAMLLLIAGMVNCIAMTSWSNGLVKAYDTFHDAVVSVLDGTRLSGKEQWRIANYLGKLDLSPDFISEYNVLVNYVEKPSVSAQERNSTLLLWSYQYLGQIVQTTCSQSSINLPSSVTPLLRELNLLGRDDNPTNATTAAQAAVLIKEVVNGVLTDIYSGVLWMYAAAGFVLILAALRSVERYKLKGPAGYVLHGFQFAGGLTLCLLSLLDIGSRTVSMDDSGFMRGRLIFHNRMYPLARSNMAVAIVFIVYAVVLAVSMACMELIWYFGPERREENEVKHNEKSAG